MKSEQKVDAFSHSRKLPFSFFLKILLHRSKNTKLKGFDYWDMNEQ